MRKKLYQWLFRNMAKRMRTHIKIKRKVHGFDEDTLFVTMTYGGVEVLKFQQPLDSLASNLPVEGQD